MNIRINLSTESIQNAIQRLKVRQIHLEEDLEQVVEILTNEGAEIAQAAYGNYNVQTVAQSSGTTGEITVAGDAALIAEFGAGQATMPVLFENAPSTPVYEGSYSELVGSQEYYKTGSWHFGGKYYTEVPARHGLLDAKQYIIEHSTEIAKEMMAYD